MDQRAWRERYDAALSRHLLDRAALGLDPAVPPTRRQRAWLANGRKRSLRRDLEHASYPGPVIPGTLATGDPHGWTPQGLTYDAASDRLLQTSYHHDGRASLWIVDATTGRLTGAVGLGPDARGAPPRHLGGIAVHGDTVLVTSAEKPPRLFAYDRSTLLAAGPGDVVPAIGEAQPVAGGAYCTVVDHTLYAGTFGKDSPGRLYTYRWDGRWVDEHGPFETPTRTQGIAVRGDHVVFSTSWGRTRPGSLLSHRMSDVLGGPLPPPLARIGLPAMAEGIAAVPAGVMTTYESGASGFVEPGRHRRKELWPATHMTLTPYADLGLPG
ncbi:hypothetical protein ABLE68_08545 [Nocardioides sp. CN2-186]|uniref:hypothetical protein n=1 Tax=Nocardioides tweenelious TaxID=3156607 RepID=UPI0032B4AEAE